MDLKSQQATLSPSNQSKRPVLRKQMTLNQDDPFSKIFIEPDEIKKQIALKLAACFKQKNQERQQAIKINKQNGIVEKEKKKPSFFPNFDGTKDSGVYGNYESDSDDGEKPPMIDTSGGGYPWQTKKYWDLPESVRHAIDVAELKSQHTGFWRRLQTLNDKIYVFRSVFYSKMPSYQRAFYEKKQKALEEQLEKEKLQYEQEMNQLSLKVKKKNSKHGYKGSNDNTPNAKKKSSAAVDLSAGITTLQMMENFKQGVRNGSAKASQGRVLPRRAQSYGGQNNMLLGLGCSNKSLVKKDEETKSSGGSSYKGKRAAGKGALKINVKEIPKTDLIKEASEKDEAMTPLVDLFKNRQNAGKKTSNHSSPTKRSPMPRNLEIDEEALSRSVSSGSDDMRNANKTQTQDPSPAVQQERLLLSAQVDRTKKTTLDHSKSAKPETRNSFGDDTKNQEKIKPKKFRNVSQSSYSNKVTPANDNTERKIYRMKMKPQLHQSTETAIYEAKTKLQIKKKKSGMSSNGGDRSSQAQSQRKNRGFKKTNYKSESNVFDQPSFLSRDKHPNVQAIGFNVHANQAKRPDLVVGNAGQNQNSGLMVLNPQSINFNAAAGGALQTPKLSSQQEPLSTRSAAPANLTMQGDTSQGTILNQTVSKISELGSTGRDVESGVGSISVPAAYAPNEARGFNALKVPNIDPQERRKKSSSRKIATGGQVVHQPGRRGAAVAPREAMAALLYREIPSKTPKSVTRNSNNTGVTKKQLSHFQASMLAAAAALSPPRPAAQSNVKGKGAQKSSQKENLYDVKQHLVQKQVGGGPPNS